jgi:hypothetical protein
MSLSLTGTTLLAESQRTRKELTRRKKELRTSRVTAEHLSGLGKVVTTCENHQGLLWLPLCSSIWRCHLLFCTGCGAVKSVGVMAMTCRYPLSPSAQPLIHLSPNPTAKQVIQDSTLILWHAFICFMLCNEARGPSSRTLWGLNNKEDAKLYFSS